METQATQEEITTIQLELATIMDVIIMHHQELLLIIQGGRTTIRRLELNIILQDQNTIKKAITRKEVIIFNLEIEMRPQIAVAAQHVLVHLEVAA